MRVAKRSAIDKDSFHCLSNPALGQRNLHLV